jgi:predicted aspartyl protease
VTVTVDNYLDHIRAKKGEIDADQVRSVTLRNVFVDTGAVHLGLAPDVIARLDLDYRKTIPIRTANGIIQARLFGGALVAIMGRDAVMEVLELPAGTPTLLGVIPLETLGLEPDLKARTLRALPLGPDDSYVTVL